VIDFRRLHVLRAVAYHGTVTAAARTLHLTPSAASQQVRQLGRELGVTLLEPHGRRVRLTPAARSLLEHAEAIEERWQCAEAELAAAEAATPAGDLRLCGIPTAISALLAPTAVRLRQQCPRVAVQIREAEPPDCFDLLFSGAVDLGVTMAAPGSPPLNDARFDQRPLLDDPYDLLTAPDHPLAGRPEITLADLANEPWILSMPGTAYRQMILAVCNTAGFTPIIAHEALEWTAVANLIGHGLGISLVHRLAQLPTQPTVVRTPLSPSATPYRRLLTVTRRGSRNHPAIDAALSVLHDIAGAHQDT
jgi:DNA-binding transcriptional LysR family regulator